MVVADIIAMLGLSPHPEGGWYVETWRGSEAEGRACGTSIYFLLEPGQRSHWHWVDATEIWHFYAGAPLVLRLSDGNAGPVRDISLGADLAAGQRPQAIVPPHHWQSAEAREGWSLVGCTVSPGFEFDGFELAPEGWEPGQG